MKMSVVKILGLDDRVEFSESMTPSNLTQFLTSAAWE